MEFKYNDGGRAEAGYKGTAGDCVVRAIAIASKIPYQRVYDDLFSLNKQKNESSRSCSPRDGGTSRKTRSQYLESLGFKWTATMGIGTGCKVHLREEELPKGRIIVKLSKHLAAVIDGILNDTYDCSREGTRCVYGYWQQ